MTLTLIKTFDQQRLPGIANYWAISPDLNKVFYHIDPQARWSDGEAVQSGDFVFYQKFIHHRLSKQVHTKNYLMHHNFQIKAHTSQVISISLNRAYPQKELLDRTNISPLASHFYQITPSWAIDLNWQIEPNTGPYQISSYDLSKSITFSRKKNWWAEHRWHNQNLYNFHHIHLSFEPLLKNRWQSFLKGRLDLFSLHPKLFETWTQEPVFKNGTIQKIISVCECKNLPIKAFFLNLSSPPFEDPHLRFALHHALDIEAMIKFTQQENLVVRNHSLFPFFRKFTNHAIKSSNYNVQKVAEHMEKSGWRAVPHSLSRKFAWQKNEEIFQTTILFANPQDQEKLEILKKRAAQAGILLNLRLLNNPQFYVALQKNDYEMIYTTIKPGNWSYPTYRDMYHSSSIALFKNNLTRTQDPTLDQMIEDYESELDETIKAKLSRDIQAKIAETGATIFTYFAPFHRNLVWRYIRFPAPELIAGKHRHNIDQAWFSLKHLNELLNHPDSHQYLEENVISPSGSFLSF